MTKRQVLHDEQNESVIKRRRVDTRDRLSTLSHELLLRILSFLPRHELSKCQLISSLYQGLAADTLLWKVLYCRRFVRPIPWHPSGTRLFGGETADAYQRWQKQRRVLSDVAEISDGNGVPDWMREYKIRHNWARGSCAVNETPIADHPHCSSMLIRMQNNMVFTADTQEDMTARLRAWRIRKGRTELVATQYLGEPGSPASLAVPDSCTLRDNMVAIGFQQGTFQLWQLNVQSAAFTLLSSHTPPASNGKLSSIALSWPYLATMSAGHRFTLYQYKDSPSHAHQTPKLLYSAVSHTMRSPENLSLRSTSNNEIEASVVYAFHMFGICWTVGLQTFRFTSCGSLLDSCATTAIPQERMNATCMTTSDRDVPKALVYKYPHIIMTRSDNTLASWHVSNQAGKLTIRGPDVLHGHTSAVSGAQIDDHHKAVSVSVRGDQICIWDMATRNIEARIGREEPRRVSMFANGAEYVTLSPRIRNQKRDSLDRASDADSSCAASGMNSESPDACNSEPVSDTDDCAVGRRWIGIDDENIVLLKERKNGPQALVVYNFAV